tara:strand:+ start:310 stop:1047 length:738 start_codon:yes stop_codon:yes gene_type:complete
VKTYLKYSGIANLAHRGGAEESFENTIESFEYARSIGCKFIETDVQVSADGIPFIFHDDDFMRLLNDPTKFSSLNSNDIKKIKIFEKHSIPTLEETLNLFPDLSFQIDFKTDDVVKPSMDVINKLNACDRVSIASFSSKRLAPIRLRYPSLCVSMGPKEIFRVLLASYGLYNKKIDGDCLQIPMKYYGIRIVTKRFVNYVQSKGLKIMVWTINDIETFKYLIELNVDGIITDRPRLLFETLKKIL